MHDFVRWWDPAGLAPTEAIGGRPAGVGGRERAGLVRLRGHKHSDHSAVWSICIILFYHIGLFDPHHNGLNYIV